MKYIIFLFCILLISPILHADPGTNADTGGSTGTGIQVNLGNDYKSNFAKPSSDFSKTMDNMNGFKADYSLTNVNQQPSLYTYSSASGGLTFGRRCQPSTPENCILISDCITNGGYWNAIDSNCGRATCHFGTTPDPMNQTRCKCNNDPNAYVQRGNFLQSCPSTCFSRPHQSYSFISKQCECAEGYTMATNGQCNPNPAPPQPANVNDCLRELAEKASSCETSANTAVTKCEPEQDDSIKALQGLLMTGGGGAAENCDRAATAGTSGFYQTENNRKSCDDGINSCKSTCEDAKKYLTEQKERAYNACREKAFQDQVNAGPPLPADRFNPLWDAENKPGLDSQFQGLMARIDTSKTTCESGTAVKNREKLSATMSDMNTASVDAAKCVCQLNPKSADCAKAPGPADCSSNPSLPGCAKVADNCFDPKNTSAKCICFRNPESYACKEAQGLNIKALDESNFATAKIDTRSGSKSSVNGMATGGGGSGDGGVTTGGGRGGDGFGGLGNLNDSGLTAPDAASGSAVSSGNDAVGGAAPSPGGKGLGGGGVADMGSQTGESVKNETMIRKLGGLFDTAKSAIGGMLGGKGSRGGDSSDGNYRNGAGSAGGGSIDPRKFRPRAVVRGIASEEELAGKHEDIWKVMNKQYKVQDQKDNFIFDAEKN